MRADLGSSPDSQEFGPDSNGLRIYRPENLVHLAPESYVDTGKWVLKTNIYLPVDINGTRHYLRVIPIVSKDKAIVGYMCWYDPRHTDLAKDSASEMIEMGKRVTPDARLAITMQSSKSTELTTTVCDGMGVGKSSRVMYSKCSVDEAVSLATSGKDGWGTLVQTITSGGEDVGVKVDARGLSLMANSPVENMLVLDDIYSTGGTVRGLRSGVWRAKSDIGEEVDRDRIKVLVAGIEVEDADLTEGYVPPNNVHGLFAFPVISNPIVKTPYDKIDLHEYSKVVGPSPQLRLNSM